MNAVYLGHNDCSFRVRIADHEHDMPRRAIDVQKKNRESRFGAHRFAVVAHEGQDLVR